VHLTGGILRHFRAFSTPKRNPAPKPSPRSARQQLTHTVRQPHGQAAVDIYKREIEMKKNLSVVLYVVVLIAVIVSVDLLFFRNRFWERLIVNISIVLVDAAFYLIFVKKQ
jgi:hypothetical protein